MNEHNAALLKLAQDIQEVVRQSGMPPPEGFPCNSDYLIPMGIVRETRDYIEKIAGEINGCYERGLYNACAVMIRRLVETLIVETYEKHGISADLMGPDGDFVGLEGLVNRTLAASQWNLGRETKKGLPVLKALGDRSAHSRRYVCHRSDIDKVSDSLRVVVQELIYLAVLK